MGDIRKSSGHASLFRGAAGRCFLICTEIMAVLSYPIAPDKGGGHCCTYFLTE